MKIIIFGASGMLGKRLVDVFKDNELITPSSVEINFSNRYSIAPFISKNKPELVINAAGYTDVDGVENNRAFAFVMNGSAVEIIVNSCKNIKAGLMHFSTDYVFDGESNTGYSEDDNPKNPVNAYGQTKFYAESSLIGYKKELHFYLIRTSWMFAEEKGFVKAIRDRALVNNELEVVSDEIGCPTYAPDLAMAVKELIVKDYKKGIYHITNSGFCSRADYAREIVRQAGLECRVIDVTQDCYIKKNEGFGKITKRPKLSVLINTKFPPLRDWKDAVGECLKNIQILEGK